MYRLRDEPRRPRKPSKNRDRINTQSNVGADTQVCPYEMVAITLSFPA